MSNIVQIKRGSGKPDGKLAPYELGIDIVDGQVYYGGQLNNEDYSYGDAQGIKVAKAEQAETANTANTATKAQGLSQAAVSQVRGIKVNAAVKATNADYAMNPADGSNLVVKTDLLNLIYPVGSIYMSVAETEPSVLFGGIWERIKDTFLLAAGDSYAAGQTGGEAEHVLTTEELPTHSHGLNGWALGIKGVSSTSTYTLAKPWTEYNNFEENGEQTIQSTGGDLAHNNMPPYLTVYMWKRTE